jgi:hypothetical protein
MSAAAALLELVPRARATTGKRASGTFASLTDLASASSDLKPANDTRQHWSAYDERRIQAAYDALERPS